MKQSIDKLANLLLARKAIHSLPANTSLTLRELNALVLERQGNASVAMAATETVASLLKAPPATAAQGANSFSGLRSDNRHPNQAPLSFLASSQMESSPGAGFQVSIRQLSSSSSSSSSSTPLTNKTQSQ